MIILILLGMLIIVKIIFPVMSLFYGSQTMCGLYYISPVRDEGRSSSRCFPHTEGSQQTLPTQFYIYNTLRLCMFQHVHSMRLIFYFS